MRSLWKGRECFLQWWFMLTSSLNSSFPLSLFFVSITAHKCELLHFQYFSCLCAINPYQWHISCHYGYKCHWHHEYRYERNARWNHPPSRWYIEWRGQEGQYQENDWIGNQVPYPSIGECDFQFNSVQIPSKFLYSSNAIKMRASIHGASGVMCEKLIEFFGLPGLKVSRIHSVLTDSLKLLWTGLVRVWAPSVRRG